MAADDFYRLVDSLLPRPQAPWDLWDDAPRIHPVFFVHRVAGVPAGLTGHEAVCMVVLLAATCGLPGAIFLANRRWSRLRTLV